VKAARTEATPPSFLNRAGEPVGPLEWDRLRSDPQYARLAQTVLTAADREVVILTTWFGMNLYPGPLFDTIRIEAGCRTPLAEYETEGAALAGHQDAVAGAMDGMDQPSVEDGVDDRWDEFVRSTFRRR